MPDPVAAVVAAVDFLIDEAVVLAVEALVDTMVVAAADSQADSKSTRRMPKCGKSSGR